MEDLFLFLPLDSSLLVSTYRQSWSSSNCRPVVVGVLVGGVGALVAAVVAVALILI